MATNKLSLKKKKKNSTNENTVSTYDCCTLAQQLCQIEHLTIDVCFLKSLHLAHKKCIKWHTELGNNNKVIFDSGD